MDSLIGVDTLKLYIKDFEVRRENSFTVQPSPYKASTGEMSADNLLWRNGVDEVRGQKAFYNDNTCQISLGVKKDSEAKLFLQCSVPKVLKGENYYMVDRQGTEEAVKKLQSTLKEVGIGADLRAAKLSRVDTCRNNFVSDEVPSYFMPLQLAQGKRMSKRDYGTTILWGNTQQEICAYDKNEEQKLHNETTKGYPANNLRIETRMLKGSKVQSATGLVTLSDLLTSDGFATVQDTYIKTLESNIFTFNPVAIDMLGQREIEKQLKYFKQLHPRNFEKLFRMSLGTQYIFQKYGFELYENAVLNVGNFSGSALRQRRSRLSKELRKQKMIIESVQGEMFPARSVGDLYTELRAMALSKAA